MRTNKGNSEVVMKDAAKIAERLRTTQTTLAEMMKKYHVAYATLMNAVFSQMSFDEWLKIRRKILARSGIKNRFPKGHFRQIKTIQKYQCCGCGQDYVTAPNICPKCNGLYFESIEIPTEIPAPARHLSKRRRHK